MNLLLLLPEECRGQSGIISGKRVHSVMERHALKPGVELTGGVLNGQIGKVVVKKLSSKEIKFDIDFNLAPPNKHNIDLVVSVARPQTIKKVVHLACTLGVRSLSFVKTDNVEKSYLSSKQLQKDYLQIEMLKGLEQAVDTVPPAVAIYKSINHLRDSFLCKENYSTNSLKLIADTKEDLKLNPSLILSGIKNAILAIGPESGWSERELEIWKEFSFQSISLGERILRVDTAVSFLVAQCLLFADL